MFSTSNIERWLLKKLQSATKQGLNKGLKRMIPTARHASHRRPDAAVVLNCSACVLPSPETIRQRIMFHVPGTPTVPPAWRPLKFKEQSSKLRSKFWPLLCHRIFTGRRRRSQEGRNQTKRTSAERARHQIRQVFERHFFASTCDELWAKPLCFSSMVVTKVAIFLTGLPTRTRLGMAMGIRNPKPDGFLLH